MKAYKVVNKNRRSILLDYWPECRRLGIILRYDKGTEVVAKENTLGVLCFNSIASTMEFLNVSMFPIKDKMVRSWKVLEIEGQGLNIPTNVIAFKMGVFETYLTGGISEVKLKHYNSLENGGVNIYRPPEGTIAFRRVKVLT